MTTPGFQTTPDLSIIIVSYNAASLLEQCLRSLFEQTTGLNLQVFVVDNASTDGSWQMIQEGFTHIHLLRNEDNVGFAAANNQAILASRGRYVLLLNPDTVILDHAVEHLLAFMESNKSVGICGPRLVYPDLRDQRSVYPFPSLKGVFALYTGLYGRFPVVGRRFAPEWICDRPDSTRVVDWCSGACLMVSRPCLDEIGLLDEQIFMYYEDTDWCRRAYEYGWQVAYYADARVIHYLGGSQDSGIGQWKRRVRELSGALYYVRKWHGPLYAAVYRGLVRACASYRYLRRAGRADSAQEIEYYRTLALGR